MSTSNITLDGKRLEKRIKEKTVKNDKLCNDKEKEELEETLMKIR